MRIASQRLPSTFAALRRLEEAPAEGVELVEVLEGYADLAGFAAVADGHLGPERKPELVLKRARVGVDGLARPPRARRFAGILAEALDVPDRQALGYDAVGERVGIGNGEQGACVPGRNLSAGEQAAGVFGQAREPKRVGDMAAALADHAGDVAVRIAMNLAELGVAGRLLERAQIGPLHVFDDGDFERLAVAGLHDDDRD